MFADTGRLQPIVFSASRVVPIFGVTFVSLFFDVIFLCWILSQNPSAVVSIVIISDRIIHVSEAS